MFRTLPLLAVFAAATAAAQVPVPIDHIDIGAARTQYSSVPAVDRSIACDDPRLSQHAQVDIYCNLLGNILDPTSVPVDFAIFATQDQTLLSGFISGIANSNLGTELSSSASAPGTDSIAKRSGYSDVLGLALESGAVTQSVSGATLNLSTNSLSLYRFFSNQEVFQYCSGGGLSCQGPAAEVLNHISASAAVSTSGVTTQSVTGTVPSGTNTSTGTTSTSGTSTTSPSATALVQNSASRLTSVTLHIQLWNSLDLRSQSYITAWKSAVGGSAVTAAAKTLEQDMKVFDWFDVTQKKYADWFTTAKGAVRAAIESGKTDEQVSDIVTAQWYNLETVAKADKAYSASGLQQFLQNANTFMSARDAAINTARQQTQSGMSLEYTFSQPVNQPKISTIRLAYTLHPGLISADAKPAAAPAKPTAAGPASKPAAATNSKLVDDFALTFNAAADLYDNPPAGISTFRDLQGAIQIDKHFGNTIGTLAGYYQYQHSASALTIGQGNLAPNTNIVLPSAAATLLAPKGNMVVAQAKLTFSLKNGASLPIGVTWSNRTELIKASEVRGHIGIDFDWSSLFASKGGQ